MNASHTGGFWSGEFKTYSGSSTNLEATLKYINPLPYEDQYLKWMEAVYHFIELGREVDIVTGGILG